MEILRILSEKHLKKKEIRKEKERVYQQYIFKLNPEFPHRENCAKQAGFRISFYFVGLSGTVNPLKNPEGECKDCGTNANIKT